MSKRTFQATKVFEQHWVAYENGKRLFLHQGGARSSKSFSIMQFLVLMALRGQIKKILIARNIFADIKHTLLPDFKELIELYNIPITPEFNFERPSQTYYINGCRFTFIGLDRSLKAHGLASDWNWFNEVMEIDKDVYEQIDMRTTQGSILDFNPSDPDHWVYDKAKNKDAVLIKSTVLDNPFIADRVRQKILSYKPTKKNYENGTADSWLWKVYGKGEAAQIKGLIFDKYEVIENIPDYAKFIGYGLDFGYSNDPTAVVALYKANERDLYVKEKMYLTGMTNDDIYNFFVQNDFDLTAPIICDSAEPKSIDELYEKGLDTYAVQKGADSVRAGIKFLKQHNLYITSDSHNLLKEFKKYKWKEDKNGNALNKPIDQFNHACDALRYVAVHELLEGNFAEVLDKKIFLG